jgi:D-tyrosyl-tRNA(Tyr) deacylase
VIGLLQRVTEASVSVEGRVVTAIGRGLVVLVGVRRGDTRQDARRLTERILGYRVFPDDHDRMNLSLSDLKLSDPNLGLLLVPQFTLAADTRKGRRASFTGAADPEVGKECFDWLLEHCLERLPQVKSGIFGAHMQVALVNDGPVTFWLES